MSPILRTFSSLSCQILFIRQASLRSIKPKWFHSTDVPISKPEWFDYAPDKEPEKFVPFSDYDGARLEDAFKRNKGKVDVKEDRLFLVDLDSMQLAPVYWKGPIYEVRRGTWFTSDGMPLSEEITQKVEAGYQKVDPGALEPQELNFAAEFAKSPKDTVRRFEKQVKEKTRNDAIDIDLELDVIDLGNGNAVVYFDDSHGAMFPSDFGMFQLNVIRSLQPQLGSLLSVVPIQRGYTKGMDSSIIDDVKSVQVPSLSEIFLNEVLRVFAKDNSKSSPELDNDSPEELLQNVLEADYEQGVEARTSKREVDHLVLCIHGIGQILGYKYESVNFTHSVNVLRNTMREVYKNEKKYHKLAYGENADEKDEDYKNNNRIQVLPISWRQEVSFHPRKPFSVMDSDVERRLPSLSEINVDGLTSLREVVGDVLLDILLYYEPRYMKQIMKAVVTEINSVYKLYMEKNPQFNGKIHVLGHSLGSAIAFDLLAYQQEIKDDSNEYQLAFDVENLFCVGSPVGVFKLLQQKNIASRADVGVDFDSTDLTAHVSSPKCKNLYNVFHPCDPVGYRMEPLVNPKFANFRAEGVPFAMEGFNTQVQSLTSIGDELTDRISQASSWFKSDATKAVSKAAPGKEDALRDVIYSLTSARGNKGSGGKSKSQNFGNEDLKQLYNLNSTGRIDYSLPMGVFSIALVSALSAHVSYFEDEETAGFVMKEILTGSQEPPIEKKVQLYK
ncbi:CIC11C00000002018 [Sungouiella intermedia]|uniref:CIC11C00000002018 n=1 Tax=Sungouiella intermedia TaxID=45354 RepID=A0A1L0BH22_9ASCO|nr:CIC11C00000002018 [[Candida] intermedia]